ncbi:hypothetical protein BT69DRAFT_1277163 [Atractiella rhizophila]|nr:hypothetical protein BT69DRAFT_1277163 [Atractiella rhizophila]
MFLELPAEILLLIVSNLDETSIFLLRLTHSTLKTIVDHNPSVVYRSIAFHKGYLNIPTASDAGITAGKLEPLRDFDAMDEELRFILKNQKELYSNLRQLNGWKEFVKKRRRLAKNWIEGKYRQKWIVTDRRRVWRFKIDHSGDHPLLILSGDGGVIQAFDLRPDIPTCVWTSPEVGRFPHVEVSQGYIITASGKGFMVWRRKDVILPPDSRGVRPETESEDLFILHVHWKPPASGRCFKARYPYLAVGSQDAIFLYDFARRELVETIRHDEPVRNDYIELSETKVFLCSVPSIFVYHRGMRESEPMERRMFQFRGGRGEDWNALHHWDGHVIATSGLGTLLWNPSIDSYDPELSVCLDTGGHIWNVCVENGRCVFVVEFARENQQWYQFHFLFPLRARWSSLDEFKELDIRIILLSGGSMGPNEISRLEMTSDAILTTMSTKQFRDDAETRALLQRARLHWHSNSRTNEELGIAFDGLDCPTSFAGNPESGFWSSPDNEDMPENLQTADAMLVHDFS